SASSRGRLTVKLRGRAPTAESAEGAQFLSARGAKPTTHHGLLQRLLGSRICGLRTMVCDARLRNAHRAFCHKCGVAPEAHRLILQLPQRVVWSNETLGVLRYLNVSNRCAARNISRRIC